MGGCKGFGRVGRLVDRLIRSVWNGVDMEMRSSSEMY